MGTRGVGENLNDTNGSLMTLNGADSLKAVYR